jgi:hypothetical protein
MVAVIKVSGGRREYAKAESRIKESIILRSAGLDHTYPGRDEDLDLMRRHHELIGEIPPERGFYSWWRKFVGGRS